MRRDTRILQDARGIGALRHDKAQQHIFRGDETIARLLRQFLGVVEHARGLRGKVNLPVSAFDLRQLGKRQLSLPQGFLGPAARGADQARGQTLLIVEQNLQKMFGGELLVVGAQRQPLGGLNETARPLGEFLGVHIVLSWHPDFAAWRARLSRSLDLDNAPDGHGILTIGGFEVPRFQEPSEALILRNAVILSLVAVGIAVFVTFRIAFVQVEGRCAGAVVGSIAGLAALLGAAAVAIHIAIAIPIGGGIAVPVSVGGSTVRILLLALLLILLLLLLLRGEDAVIMFGVLEIVLRHHAVARGVGIARELQIFLIHMGSRTADLHFRPG